MRIFHQPKAIIVCINVTRAIKPRFVTEKHIIEAANTMVVDKLCQLFIETKTSWKVVQFQLLNKCSAMFLISMLLSCETWLNSG